MKHLVILLFVLIGGWSLSSPVHAQTSGQPFIEITAPEVSSFPMVTFNMRVQMGDYNILPALTREQIEIGERHDPSSVSLTTSQSTLATVFVIDTSLIGVTEKDLYREIVRNYVNTVHRPIDQLFLVGLTGETLTEYTGTTNIEAFYDTMFRQSFDGRPSINGQDLTDALNQAVSRLTPVMSGSKTQIIYLQSYSDSYRREANFANRTIPLHVIQASDTTRSTTNPLNNLATAGAIPIMTDGRVALSSLVENSLRDLYAQFNFNRTMYGVSYRSTQAAVGERRLPITLRSTFGNLTTTLSYTKDVTAPVLTLQDNVGNVGTITVERNFVNSDESLTNYDNTSTTIVATVTYTDGIPRQNLTATLLIDGQPVQAPLLPVIDAFNQFRIEWDLTPYQEAGTRVFTAMVTMVDEYQLPASSPTLTYNIVVAELIIPTEIVVEQIDVCIDPTSAQYGSLDCALKDNPVVVLGVVLVLLVAVVFLIWMVATQRLQLSKVGNVIGSASKMMTDIGRKSMAIFERTKGDYDTNATNYENTGGWSNTSAWGNNNHTQPYPVATDIDQPTQPFSLGGTQLEVVPNNQKENPMPTPWRNTLARLIVSGVPNLSVIDIPHDIEEYIIGRTLAYGCSFVINDLRVSNRHFILHYHHGKRSFSIENLSKSNGTFVNGMKLDLEMHYPIQNGDMIRITQREPFIELRFTTQLPVTTANDTKIERDISGGNDDEFNYPVSNFPDTSAFDPYVGEVLFSPVPVNSPSQQTDIEDDTNPHGFIPPEDSAKRPPDSGIFDNKWDD